jgi:hypothetical protein
VLSSRRIATSATDRSVAEVMAAQFPDLGLDTYFKLDGAFP